MAGFQQLKVNRDLVFTGAAAYQPNIKGPMMSELKIFDETFMADAEEHDWGEEASNGCTIDHGSADGGVTTLTCGATANDCGELYHLFQWTPYYACGMEARVKISAITNVCVAVGFVDAKEDLNNHISIEMNGTALYAATKCDEFAGMVFDTSAGTDVWYCGWSEGGTERTPVAAPGSLEPVADTYFRVRVQTDRDGNVDFYYNGAHVGHAQEEIASAVTDLLSPYVGIISRSGSVVCTVTRITTWQECS